MSVLPGEAKPDLVVRSDDLTVTARDLARIIAQSGHTFDRGGPVKVVTWSPDSPMPQVQRLTPDRLVIEAHILARPVVGYTDFVPVTLPQRAARLYLALDEWGLPPLKGLTTAPLLFPDGSIRSAQGYDPRTGLWCANVPHVELASAPSFEDAKAALGDLRSVFQTFPFGDATRLTGSAGVDLVDLTKPPAQDESTLLCGLLTATCRCSLALAPGLLVTAPTISGAGSGKGLLVRAISAIAFGVEPRAFNAGENVAELDKRIASELMEASAVLFLDNVNARSLRSDLLASVLTEPLVGVRVLGASRMTRLNASAFVAVTGNGLTISEDLTRRFVVCELDPRVENPERRPFAPSFYERIVARRAELLGAALTIWRWGRINAPTLKRGLPFGSYETWSEWIRDPLLALGCADPVERMALIKGRDPTRARLAGIFAAWWDAHADRPVTVGSLAPAIFDLIDWQHRGRQFVASYLLTLANTRVAGFVLTRQESPGKWSPATYALRRTDNGAAAPSRETL